ncbi:MAG: DNA mismatch repair endonuclease MutL [Eubacterium sp.]|nr:DNA mismatch repair endonuclease MutL [Eubacterium sp.]
MSEIQLLDEHTIDQIAAGEVVDRPSSVVKELVENAVDAKATAITIEIKEGGISFIRITDNGQGIPKEQVPIAFARHATSKLKSIEDLLTISSLGFRGEALSSIASVSQVELITKTASELSGTKYKIEGSKEISLEEIGAPEGTTFLVRNLFYNTPARRKFLKSAQTEASYISTLVERLALSHPDISFQLIVNNQPKLHTNGNTKLKDIIYHIFGRDITSGLLSVDASSSLLSVKGYIGKPFTARGNRSYEMYFINGRYIKSPLLAKCIEDAYKPFLMKHQYPFTVLQLTIDSGLIDVNVHPAKMEIRFQQSDQLYAEFTQIIREALEHKDMVPEVLPGAGIANKSEKQYAGAKPMERKPEPFEKKRLEAIAQAVKKDSPYEPKYKQKYEPKCEPKDEPKDQAKQELNNQADNEQQPAGQNFQQAQQPAPVYEQLAIAESGASYHADFIKEAKRCNYTLIGQLFDTYWLVEVEKELFIIDQHAAHEKVLYEKMMAQLLEHTFTSQQVSPPVILTLTMQEQELYKACQDAFTRIGFEVNPFGGREYAIQAVPANLYGIEPKELFLEMLDGLSHDIGNHTPDTVLEKIASMACKAAVKGRQKLSSAEANQLLSDLLALEHPYQCPHGRPTMIAMSQTEIERKFKRIV